MKILKGLILLIVCICTSLQICASDYNAIYAWIEGSGTCYRLEDVPTVTYSTENGQKMALLTLKGESDPCLSLPLSEGKQLIVTFGQYVQLSTTLDSYGWATFSCSQPVRIISGAFVCRAVLDGNLLRTYVVESGKVPAYTGVLLFGRRNAPVQFKLIDSAPNMQENDLKPTETATGLAELEPAYVLHDNELCIFSGSAFLPAKAYLPKSLVAPGARIQMISPTGELTGISYNPAVDDGVVQRSGKYIYGGRLVVVRKGRKYNTAGDEIVE